MSFIPIEAKHPPLPVKVEGVLRKERLFTASWRRKSKSAPLCPIPNYTHKFMVFKIHLRWSIPVVADSKDTLFFIDTASEWAV